jgi:hypothetical protein
MDIEALRQADREARNAYFVLENEKNVKQRERETAAVWTIRDSIAQEYNERLNALSKKRDETSRLLAIAEAEIGKADLVNYPSGPVFEWRHSYGIGNKRLTGRRGIFEVCTPETEFAGNVGSYRRPKPGDIFIRVLKKDGTPGLAFETKNWNGKFSSNWLPEGKEPT